MKILLQVDKKVIQIQEAVETYRKYGGLIVAVYNSRMSVLTPYQSKGKFGFFEIGTKDGFNSADRSIEECVKLNLREDDNDLEVHYFMTAYEFANAIINKGWIFHNE